MSTTVSCGPAARRQNFPLMESAHRILILTKFDLRQSGHRGQRLFFKLVSP
jgi:hypothetical protein